MLARALGFNFGVKWFISGVKRLRVQSRSQIAVLLVGFTGVDVDLEKKGSNMRDQI